MIPCKSSRSVHQVHSDPGSKPHVWLTLLQISDNRETNRFTKHSKYPLNRSTKRIFAIKNIKNPKACRRKWAKFFCRMERDQTIGAKNTDFYFRRNIKSGERLDPEVSHKGTVAIFMRLTLICIIEYKI